MQTLAIERDTLLRAVDAAILAPSMFNVQPWRFRLAGGGLEVWADRDRWLGVADPTGRAARLACG
ncbi:MAG TPA: nitroreductase family protein, partial [Rugosimonospora sp.]|nr:nitroreductase family protein [Rugosimonospora sp.]